MLFEASDVFDYPWPSISLGIWSKYPNNDAPHVISVDTLARSLDPETGLVRTERLIGCKQNAPAWFLRLVGTSSETYVREVSVVDPGKVCVKAGDLGAPFPVKDEEDEDDSWFSRKNRTNQVSGGSGSASPSSLLSGPASDIRTIPAPSPSITMRSINLTLRSLLEVQEIISYRPHPDPALAATRTLFEQSAQIKAYGYFSKLARKIEATAFDRFGENAAR